MFRRRRRGGLFDSFFRDIDELFESIEKSFERVGEGDVLGYGYSIQVTQGPEGTKVYVKAGRNVDVASLRRELEERYPDAEIHIEGGRPLIREVSSETPKGGKEKSKKGVWMKVE